MASNITQNSSAFKYDEQHDAKQLSFQIIHDEFYAEHDVKQLSYDGVHVEYGYQSDAKGTVPPSTLMGQMEHGNQGGAKRLIRYHI